MAATLDKTEAERAAVGARTRGDLLALPLSREGELGVYPEGSIDIIKEARAAGIAAGWADDAENRTYHAERSAELIIAAVLSIPAGVAVSAIWAWLAGALGKKGEGRVRLDILRETFPDGSTREWLHYEGRAEDVAKQVARDRPPELPPGSSHD